MQAQYYDKVYEVPDELGTDPATIRAWIEKNAGAPQSSGEPSLWTYTKGALQTGGAELYHNLGNLANLVGSAGWEKQAREKEAEARAMKSAQTVAATPPTSTLGQLAFGVGTFVPELPLYLGGEALAMQGLKLVPKVGARAAEALTAVKGEGILAGTGRAVGRGALAGGAVGSVTAEPGSSPLERAGHAYEEAKEFAVGVGILHPAFAVLRKAVGMALGKSAARVRSDADLRAALENEKFQEQLKHDGDIQRQLEQYEEMQAGQAALEKERERVAWYEENQPFGQTVEPEPGFGLEGRRRPPPPSQPPPSGGAPAPTLPEGAKAGASGQAGEPARLDQPLVQGEVPPTTPAAVAEPKRLSIKFVSEELGRRLSSLGATRAEVKAIVDQVTSKPMTDMAVRRELMLREMTSEEVAALKPEARREELNKLLVEERLDAEIEKRAPSERPVAGGKLSDVTEMSPQLAERIRREQETQRSFEAKVDELAKAEGVSAEKIADKYQTPEAIHEAHRALTAPKVEAAIKQAAPVIGKTDARGLELVDKVLESTKDHPEYTPERLRIIRDDLAVFIDQLRSARGEELIKSAGGTSETALKRRRLEMTPGSDFKPMQRRLPKDISELTPEERAEFDASRNKPDPEMEAWLESDASASEIAAKAEEAGKPAPKVVETAEDWEKKLSDEGLGVIEPDGVILDFAGLQKMYEIVRNNLRKAIDPIELAKLGRGLMLEGSKDFDKFKARVQEISGDTWPQVRGHVKKMHEDATAWLNSLGEQYTVTNHGTKLFWERNAQGELGYDLSKAGTGEGAAYRGWGAYETRRWKDGEVDQAGLDVVEKGYAERLARNANRREGYGPDTTEFFVGGKSLRETVVDILRFSNVEYKGSLSSVKNQVKADLTDELHSLESLMSVAKREIEVEKTHLAHMAHLKTVAKDKKAEISYQLKTADGYETFPLEKAELITQAKLRERTTDMLSYQNKVKKINNFLPKVDSIESRGGTFIQLGNVTLTREIMQRTLGVYEGEWKTLLSKTPEGAKEWLSQKAGEYRGFVERQSNAMKDGIEYVEKQKKELYRTPETPERSAKIGEFIKKIDDYLREKIKYDATLEDIKAIQAEIEAGNPIQINTTKPPKYRPVVYIAAHSKEAESKLIDLDKPLQDWQRDNIIKALEKRVAESGEGPNGLDILLDVDKTAYKAVWEVYRRYLDGFIGDGDAITKISGILTNRIANTSDRTKVKALGSVLDKVVNEPLDKSLSGKRKSDFSDLLNILREEKAGPKENGPSEGIKGNDLQYKLWLAFGKGDTHAPGARKATSEFLRDEAGIPGNTFVSESAGARTFVWFDPSHKKFVGEYTLDFMGLQQGLEAFLGIARDFRKDGKSIVARELGEQLLGKNGKQWLVDKRPDFDKVRVWEPWLRIPIRLAEKIGGAAEKLVSDLIQADLRYQYMVKGPDGHYSMFDSVSSKLSKPERLELTKVLDGKAKPSNANVAEAAATLNDWFKIMWDKRIKAQLADFESHLKPEENEALLNVINKGMDPGIAFAKFEPKDQKVLKSLLDDYKELQSRKIDNYRPHVERGDILLQVQTEKGKFKTVAVALNSKDAVRKALALREVDPSIELFLDTNFAKDLPQGISKGQYWSVAARLSKANAELLKDINGEIGKGEAGAAARRAMRGIFVIKPTQKFSEYELRRMNILKGEEDVFDTLYSYAYKTEKKLALDPIIAQARKVINDEYAGQPNTQAFLRDLIDDVKGTYSWQDKAADDLMRWLGKEDASMSATKLAGNIRMVEGYLKLGYRPISALFNYLGGQSNVWAKFGTQYFKEGYEFLRTKEGQKFLKEMEPVMGQTFSHEGEALNVRGQRWMNEKNIPWWFQPMGLFERPEIPNRSIGLAAPYMYALKELKLPEAAAREFAMRQNWFSQATYNIANMPKLMRSPLGRTAGQFKTYMVNQVEFMATLRGPEAFRYIAAQIALGGPRGAVSFLKSVPFLAMMPWWDEMEDWMNKEYPNFSRGVIGGMMGMDVTGPSTLQFPTSVTDWLGPFVNDVIKVHRNVVSPYLEGAKPMPKTPGEAAEVPFSALEQVSPVIRYWPKLLIDRIAHPSQDSYIIKDQRGREIYRLEPFDLVKEVMGGTPTEAARITQFQANERRRQKIENQRKGNVVNAVVEAMAEGNEIPEGYIDELIALGIKPASLRREAKLRSLPPEIRMMLQTQLSKRADLLERHPYQGD